MPLPSTQRISMPKSRRNRSVLPRGVRLKPSGPCAAVSTIGSASGSLGLWLSRARVVNEFSLLVEVRQLPSLKTDGEVTTILVRDKDAIGIQRLLHRDVLIDVWFHAASFCASSRRSFFISRHAIAMARGIGFQYQSKELAVAKSCCAVC